MGSHRIERTTEDIKRELTAIFKSPAGSAGVYLYRKS